MKIRVDFGNKNIHSRGVYSDFNTQGIQITQQTARMDGVTPVEIRGITGRGVPGKGDVTITTEAMDIVAALWFEHRMPHDVYTMIYETDGDICAIDFRSDATEADGAYESFKIQYRENMDCDFEDTCRPIQLKRGRFVVTGFTHDSFDSFL